MLVKQPCYIQTKNVKIILKNDHLWSFFNIIYTFLGSTFEPCYIQNCVIMNHVIKRLKCISIYCLHIPQSLFLHDGTTCVMYFSLVLKLLVSVDDSSQMIRICASQTKLLIQLKQKSSQTSHDACWPRVIRWLVHRHQSTHCIHLLLLKDLQEVKAI